MSNSAKKRRPSWWQLWLLLPALGVPAYLEAQAALSEAGHRIVELAIVLIAFGLVALWLRANEGAMLREIDASAERTVRRQIDELVIPSLEAVDIQGSPSSASPRGGGNGHRRSAARMPGGQREPAERAHHPGSGGQGA